MIFLKKGFRRTKQLNVAFDGISEVLDAHTGVEHQIGRQQGVGAFPLPVIVRHKFNVAVKMSLDFDRINLLLCISDNIIGAQIQLTISE